MNFGGPGESGIQYLLGYAPLLRSLLAHADVVSFDPRGVGQSAPIRCLDGPQEDALIAAEPDVSTPTGLARATSLARGYAQACEAKHPSTLRFFNTVDTARDMDRVRAATGDPRWTYIGYSYGTELGWVYDALFPKRVRAAVLDLWSAPAITAPPSKAATNSTPVF